jgi:hypothetical protein
MEGAGPAPLRATIKQYPNNNPANPQILEILIQTKYSLNSVTIKQYSNSRSNEIQWRAQALRPYVPQSNNIPITILQILKSWKS